MLQRTIFCSIQHTKNIETFSSHFQPTLMKSRLTSKRSHSLMGIILHYWSFIAYHGELHLLIGDRNLVLAENRHRAQRASGWRARLHHFHGETVQGKWSRSENEMQIPLVGGEDAGFFSFEHRIDLTWEGLIPRRSNFHMLRVDSKSYQRFSWLCKWIEKHHIPLSICTEGRRVDEYMKLWFSFVIGKRCDI